MPLHPPLGTARRQQASPEVPCGYFEPSSSQPRLTGSCSSRLRQPNHRSTRQSKQLVVTCLSKSSLCSPQKDHVLRKHDCYAARAIPTMSGEDRKSTRLNSSHLVISYAVF